MPDTSHLDDRDHFNFAPQANKKIGHKDGNSGLQSVLQGRYQLIRQLGQGGMGTVHLANDHRLSDRSCVVKRLRADFFREEDRQKALSFFNREAKVLSSLKHPNIVFVQDYFEENGEYFLVMEYVEGENLERKLTKQGSPFAELLVRDWAVKICEVLHYLHSHDPPVIYRDLKPSNIMVDTDGNIKLVDFGIARPYAEETDNTHVISGGYSPPEQYWGGADPRSDIYGLGATMQFLLTGKEPLALQRSVPKEINPQISDFIDHIVQKATAQDVQDRYPNVIEMLADLTSDSDQPPVQLPWKGFVLGAGLVLILVGTFALYYWQSESHSIKTLPPVSLSQKDHSKSKTKPSADSVKLDNSQLLPKLQNKISDTNDVGSDSLKSPYALDSAVSDDREEVLSDPESLDH